MKTEESVVSLENTKEFDQASESLSATIQNAPFRLIVHILSSLWAFIQPYGPQLVPIIIYACLIPIVSFLSISTGWIVWSRIASGWETPIFLQYGDLRAPYAHTHISSISAYQPYDIFLALSLPPIDSNLVLGNFMTTLILTSPANKTLAEVRIPSIVLPSRRFWPFSDSIDNMKIPLLQSFSFTTSEAFVFVEVGRRDGWTSLGNGQGRELTVATASLQGRIVHQGVRGFITRAPFTFSVLASLAFYIITMVIVGVFVLPLAMPRDTLPPVVDVDDTKPSVTRAQSSDRETTTTEEEQQWGHRRRSRSRLSSPRESISNEAPSAIISPPHIPRQPLRRRRSSGLGGSLSDSDE